MRLLVACPKCHRQYDATGRTPGRRFRCRCGEAVTIPQPQGHDAAVVRCSSCGAPREELALQCTYCSADFTLHERDLHTVCPACMTRVSDRAKFCHSCGGKLTPETLVADGSTLACPVCGDGHTLSHRRIGGIAVLECGRCAGLWLETKTFEDLCERAKSEAVDLELLVDLPRGLAPDAAPTDMPKQDRWQYRNCPVCRAMMHRRNYGRRSGVIIDVCRHHGIWFDADELHRILEWIRSAGMAQAEQQQAEQAAQEKRWKELGKTPGEGTLSGDSPAGVGWETWMAASFLGDLISFFTWRH